MDGRDNNLVSSYLSGESICSLANKYSITKQRVSQILQKRNVHRSPVCVVRRNRYIGITDEVKRMRMEGYSYKAIAQKIGSSIKLLKDIYGKIPRYHSKKYCCDCGEVKSIDSFYPKNRRCIQCLKESSNKRKQWRSKILENNNYTCVKCGAIADIAHHIKSWVEYRDLRYDLTNGMALCKKCHKNIHFGIRNNP